MRFCANDSVRINNTSTVNVGSVVKVHIYWDNLGAPATFEIDDNPYPNKPLRTCIELPGSADKDLPDQVPGFSGETCIDETFKTITINASPVFNSTQSGYLPEHCTIPDFAGFRNRRVPGIYVFTGRVLPLQVYLIHPWLVRVHIRCCTPLLPISVVKILPVCTIGILAPP